MEAERNHHGGPWRCFHCDDVFTTVGAASDHFGPHPAATPGCVIDKILPEGGTNTQRGLGLLMALRKAEAELARYREEDTDLHRRIHGMQAAHRTALEREEEKGYAAGLRDARGQFSVAVELLRECVGPLEVSAALIESDDGEQMEALIQRLQKFIKDAGASSLAGGA